MTEAGVSFSSQRTHTLRRASRSEEGRYHTTSLMCGVCKEVTQKNLQNREGLTDLENELMVGGGKDGPGVWDGHGQAAVFNMENQQGPTGQPRELCSILCNNLMVTRGKDGGRERQGVWDGHGHTAVFNMENPQGPAGQHKEVCSMLWGSQDGRAVWGRMDTCMCIAEFLCCSSETLTTLLIGYTPV